MQTRPETYYSPELKDFQINTMGNQAVKYSDNTDDGRLEIWYPDKYSTNEKFQEALANLLEVFREIAG